MMKAVWSECLIWCVSKQRALLRCVPSCSSNCWVWRTWPTPSDWCCPSPASRPPSEDPWPVLSTRFLTILLTIIIPSTITWILFDHVMLQACFTMRRRTTTRRSTCPDRCSSCPDCSAIRSGASTAGRRPRRPNRSDQWPNPTPCASKKQNKKTNKQKEDWWFQFSFDFFVHFQLGL